MKEFLNRKMSASLGNVVEILIATILFQDIKILTKKVTCDTLRILLLVKDCSVFHKPWKYGSDPWVVAEGDLELRSLKICSESSDHEFEKQMASPFLLKMWWKQMVQVQFYILTSPLVVLIHFSVSESLQLEWNI